MKSKRHNQGTIVTRFVYTHKGIVDGDQPEQTDVEVPVVDPIVRDRKIVVDVRMRSEISPSDAPPHPTTKVWFVAECKDPDLTIEGTDIEAVRAGVYAALDRHYAIQWTPYLLITVSAPYLRSMNDGGGICLEWENVWKGIAWDGKELLRKVNPVGQQQREFYRISVWPGQFKDSGGKVIACILDTETNRAGLQEFVKQLNLLRDMLRKFLSPEDIAKTLADLAGNRLLPAPDPDA
jgi:hypothetical protein